MPMHGVTGITLRIGLTRTQPSTVSSSSRSQEIFGRRRVLEESEPIEDRNGFSRFGSKAFGRTRSGQVGDGHDRRATRRYRTGFPWFDRGCAVAKDHKSDPVSMGEYYSLAGIFKSTVTIAEVKRDRVARSEHNLSLRVSIEVCSKARIAD